MTRWTKPLKIRLQGDEEAASLYIGRAKKELAILETEMEKKGWKSFERQVNLPDNTSLRIGIIYGQAFANIVNGPVEVPQEPQVSPQEPAIEVSDEEKEQERYYLLIQSLPGLGFYPGSETYNYSVRVGNSGGFSFYDSMNNEIYHDSFVWDIKAGKLLELSEEEDPEDHPAVHSLDLRDLLRKKYGILLSETFEYHSLPELANERKYYDSADRSIVHMLGCDGVLEDGGILPYLNEQDDAEEAMTTEGFDVSIEGLGNQPDSWYSLPAGATDQNPRKRWEYYASMQEHGVYNSEPSSVVRKMAYPINNWHPYIHCSGDREDLSKRRGQYAFGLYSGPQRMYYTRPCVTPVRIYQLRADHWEDYYYGAHKLEKIDYKSLFLDVPEETWTGINNSVVLPEGYTGSCERLLDAERSFGQQSIFFQSCGQHESDVMSVCYEHAMLDQGIDQSTGNRLTFTWQRVKRLKIRYQYKSDTLKRKRQEIEDLGENDDNDYHVEFFTPIPNEDVLVDLINTHLRFNNSYEYTQLPTTDYIYIGEFTCQSVPFLPWEIREKYEYLSRSPTCGRPCPLLRRSLEEPDETKNGYWCLGRAGQAYKSAPEDFGRPRLYERRLTVSFFKAKQKF